MVTVNEATEIIFSNLFRPIPEKISIHNAIGRILGEKILADRDFPPFDRVAMDGIAIAFESWKSGRKEFFIEQTQAAGEPQKKLTDKKNCLEVMTGSVLPEASDTVIRYEDLELEAKQATITLDTVQLHQNIHQQGQDARQGSVLLEEGVMLSPAEIALLASVGKDEVQVFHFPKTAIISSGDELVNINKTPQPYQIRRSNTYAIEAAMNELHWKGTQFHLPDRKQELKSSLGEIADEYDVMILSGGISKGKFDYIPEVLEEIGVKKLFHQVNQRPGKPFWFGVSPGGKTVFALPGNPVSTYLCFYKYIRPWILKSMGVSMRPQFAVLASDFSFAPNLSCFLQVKVRNEQGKIMAFPNAGGGSGDFANLKDVSGFLELPAEKVKFEAGEVFPYIPWRGWRM